MQDRRGRAGHPGACDPTVCFQRREPNGPTPSTTLAPMHIDTLTAPEQRVLGCLIEKRFTTPDQYPLTLNALRLACNQSTNRDPVVNYDETTVREAAQRLARYGLARLASGHTSRATKYRHLAEDALGARRRAAGGAVRAAAARRADPGRAQAADRADGRAGSLAAVERCSRADRARLCGSGSSAGQDRRRSVSRSARGRARGRAAPPARRRRRHSPAPPAQTAPSATAPSWRRGLHAPGGEVRAARRSSSLSSLERASLGRQREADQEGRAADDHAGERHLEAGRPPGAQRHQRLRGADQEVGDQRDRGGDQDRACRCVKMNGITGIIAPRPVEMPAATAA